MAHGLLVRIYETIKEKSSEGHNCLWSALIIQTPPTPFITVSSFQTENFFQKENNDFCSDGDEHIAKQLSRVLPAVIE